MIKQPTTVVWWYFIPLLLLPQLLRSQATINVSVVSVSVANNEDCDGFLSGDSDFVWEFIATDNTLGYSNNNPVLFGLLGDFNYAYQNGNNGPYTMTAPGSGFSPNSGLFFSHDYVCATDIPTTINFNWRAYENDEATNYSLLGLLTDGETSNQNVSMPVPVSAGTTTQTFNASSTDGGCPQTYSVTFAVTYIPLVIDYLEDNICDAAQVALNTTYTLGWCSSVTLEPNEPNTGDVSSNKSVWFYFVAPASGEVEITSDLSGTEFGTYFEIYHAADGNSCTTGLHPLTAAVIKDKFEYLSHYEYSDGIDFLGVDPEAEIILDACDPLSPFSYQKLIAGETYYVQLTSDDSGASGYYEVRVNDLGGGSPGNTEDIPCLSPTAAFGTTVISSDAGSSATINLDFNCAYDGGNAFGETGAAHTSSNPDEYHAYDYDHSASNNGTVNESVWTNFIAPNNGRIVFEGDYQSAVYSENAALFGFDKRFSPGIPSDYSCANLENLAGVDGGINGFLGGQTQSAIIMQPCLEPGYTYYGMVDPVSGLDPFSAQNMDVWIHDPSVADPINNPPGNDILCITMLDPLYEVVVTPAGITPPFQAVAGDNERACTEYLAGEPPAHPLQPNRADQTVWHYFTVPPSGAIEMNLRAYIGMDTLRYAVYELLNGTDCYGGLNPATFTTDGTQTSPIITPVLQGTAGFEGTQESICCMTPGTIYAIQLDGGSPGDEGQYIIEYIREVESYSGDTYVELADASIIDLNSSDTAFICAGDDVIPGNLLDGNGDPTLDIPSCLTPGFVMHSTLPIPDPVTGSGFTYIDTLQGLNGAFTNDSDGSGTFGNPLYNTVYYISSMADDPAAWGDFLCPSSTVDNSVTVVFLEPVVPVYSYDNALCEITFTATGGVSAFNGTNFSYIIEDGSMNLVATGTFAPGVNVVYSVPSAEIFTITITDGSCPYTFVVDASACGNPCIITPILQFVSTTICEGDSIYLEGAYQSTPGLYTDVFIAANGCDSTIFTTLDFSPPSYYEQTLTICEGSTFTVGTSVYDLPGVYSDTLVAVNGCDSIVTTNLFVEPILGSSYSITLCQGQSYVFDGNTLSTSGTYTQILPAMGGCDSVVTMYLFVNPTISNSIGATICGGQTYVLGSQNLTASGQYTEMFTTASGCDSSVTVFLTVDDVIDTTFAVELCMPESYTLGTQILSTSGIYSEMFTTAGGCDSLVTVEFSSIDCDAALIISNVCTPNADGFNDTWKVSDLSVIAGCQVQVFNRWGQLLYETNDYQNNWDGTKDGEQLPDGVYYYAIGCDADKQYQGVINLMRFKK